MPGVMLVLHIITTHLGVVVMTMPTSTLLKCVVFDGGGDSYVVVYGCTDSNATNYNPDANTDDGLCEFALVQGCTDAVVL